MHSEKSDVSRSWKIKIWISLLLVSIPGSTALGVLMILGYGYLKYGTLSAGKGLLLGKPLLLEPLTFDLGLVDQGANYLLTLKVQNLTSTTVYVFGLKSYCSADGCIGCETIFPLEVHPKGIAYFSIRVHLSGSLGRPLCIVTELYTNLGAFEIPIKGIPKGCRMVSRDP